MEVLGCAVTFIKTLKLSGVINLRGSTRPPRSAMSWGIRFDAVFPLFCTCKIYCKYDVAPRKNMATDYVDKVFRENVVEQKN